MRNGRCIVNVAPAPKCALNCETAAVPIEHMFDQRQPQSGSALGPAVGHIDPIKAFGEARQMFGSYARTVVSYRDARFRRARARLSTRRQ